MDKVGTPGATSTEKVDTDQTQKVIADLKSQIEALQKEKETLTSRYENAERKIGEQGTELGMLRKLVEELEKKNETGFDSEFGTDEELEKIETKKVEKIVERVLKPQVERLNKLSAEIEAKAILQEIPDLKDTAKQQAILDLLAQTNTPPTPWAIRVAYKELYGRKPEEIKKEAEEEIIRKLKERGVELPEPGGSKPEITPEEAIQNFKQRLIEVSKRHTL